MRKEDINLNLKKTNIKKKAYILDICVFHIFLIFLLSIYIFNFKNIYAKENLSLEEQKKIVEENIKEAEERKKNLNLNLDESTKEFLDLQDKLVLRQNEITDLQEKEYKYVKEGKELEEDIKIAKSRANTLGDEARKRILTMYELGVYSKWEMLLTSGSISNLISNYRILKQTAKNDSRLFEEANLEFENLKKKEEKFNKIYSNILDMRKELEEKRVMQENLVILKDTKIKDLTYEQKELFSKLEELEKSRLTIENEIKASESVIGRIDRYVGGTFAWPVPSCPSTKWITAKYGQGYAQGYPGYFHTGVDIAPPYAIVGSATAVSAADGRVIIAKNGTRGYGNYVVVDHGGNVFTLYGHASKILVSAGDMVKKGQDLIIIGSTGFSTGPHLHFELRLGGSEYKYHKDPLPYITSPKIPLEDLVIRLDNNEGNTAKKEKENKENK